jgi:hypothetical protein
LCLGSACSWAISFRLATRWSVGFAAQELQVDSVQLDRAVPFLGGL